MSETTYQELYDYYKSNLQNLKEKKNRLESQGNLCAYEICKISELEFHIKILSKTVEACEKQIAKKPDIDYVDDDQDGEYARQIWTCKKCDNIYLKKGQKYCDDCGEKLDWGKE